MNKGDKRGTITHLSLKNLYEYKKSDNSNEELILNDRIIDIIKVIAKLTKIEQETSRTILTFTDNGYSVSFIQNKKIEDNALTTDNKEYKLGNYYEFFLNMKYFNRINYYIFNIKEIVDFNVYTVYLLSIVWDYKERNKKMNEEDVIKNENGQVNLEEKLLKLIEKICSDENKEEISFYQIKNQLNMNNDELKEKLNTLVNSGNLYSNIQNETYGLIKI